MTAETSSPTELIFTVRGQSDCADLCRDPRRGILTDFSDEEAVAEMNAKLEDDRILLGYVSGEGRGISVHALTNGHDTPVRSRL